MADRRPRPSPPAPSMTATLTAAGNAPITGVLTSAGSVPTATEAYNAYINVGWQQQAWAYYHTNGPLNFGMEWLSGAMSRVSLLIAEAVPNAKAPIPLDNAAAIDILNQIKWDESRILGNLAVQVSVPGRGYLVGEEIARGVTEWNVYSPDQVRPFPASKKRSGSGYEWEIWRDGREWEPLTDALVVVVRDPDKRYSWLDTSNVQAALGALREIDLYDRSIIASLVSRIANNGILLVPDEVTFPTREQYNDNDDPFMLELIEVAKQSIKDPGSASAAIPMPLRVPSQFIDKFKHLILASGVDERVLDARKEAYEILADTVNLPREIITGISDVNHSKGLMFDLEEASIKIHISPLAELMCRDLTRGFLQPQLLAAKQPLVGPNGGRIVVWYDTSALAAKPDLSEKSVELYDRLELSGEALRRETGFTEEDAPSADELHEMILKKVAAEPSLTLTALQGLSGAPSVSTVGVEDQAAEQIAEADEDEAASERRGNVGAPTTPLEGGSNGGTGGDSGGAS